MTVAIVPPNPYFPYTDKGKPVYNGALYIGESGKNPKQYPIQVNAIDSQGVATVLPLGVDTPCIYTGSGGVPLYNGIPVRLVVDGDYSILLEDSNEVQIYYSQSETGSYQGDGQTVIDDFEALAEQAIRNAGGVPLGDGQWGIGKTYTAYNQYLVFNGVPYKPLSIPYTTQGADPTQSPDKENVQPWQNLSELQTLERAYNSQPGSVIYETNTINAIPTHIRNSANSTTYKVPAVAQGSTIISVAGNQLTSSTGVYTLYPESNGVKNTANLSDLLAEFGIAAWAQAANFKNINIDTDSVKSGEYIIPAGQSIVFMSTTVTQSDNSAAFTASSVGWSMSGKGKITRAAGRPTALVVGSIGISVLQGSVEHSISGSIDVTNFGEAGVKFNGGGVLTGDVSYASTAGLRCWDNWDGYVFLDGFSSEYHSLTNCWSKFNANDGVLLESGNVTWNGGGIISNDNAGVRLRHPAAGGNPHHGTFTGTLINHNVEHSVLAEKVSVGHSFANCNFFDNADKSKGRITLDNCRDVSFVGGTLACAVEYLDDGSHPHRGYNLIKDMSVRDDVTADGRENIFISGNYRKSGTWLLNDNSRFNATVRANSDLFLTGNNSYNLTNAFNHTLTDNRNAIHPTFRTLIQPYEAEVFTDIDAVVYLNGTADGSTLLLLMIDETQTGNWVGVKTFQVQPMTDATGVIAHLKASHTFNIPKDAQVSWFLQHNNSGTNTVKELGLMRFIADY